jgi:sugar transferase (PEP-CTERM system associated)
MLSTLKKYYPVRKVFFFLGEGALIFIVINGIYLLFSGFDIFCIDFVHNAACAISTTVVFQLTLYFFDLYDMRKIHSFMDTSSRMLQAFGVGCIILAGLYFSFPQLGISSVIFFSSAVVIFLALTAWRALYCMILSKELFAHPLLIIGTGKIAAQITEEIEDNQDSGFKITGFIGNSAPSYNPGKAQLFPLDTPLIDACAQTKTDRIVVALDDRRGMMPIKSLLECKLLEISIDDGISFFEAVSGKILVENVNPAWLIFSNGFQPSRFSYFIKRVLDIILSIFLLILSLPLSLLTALLIKMESPGPIFYLQDRVGEREETFKVIKFRSMRQDAEKDGAVWAMKDDNRVTRTGEIIRKIRIDEIPQMWNVLKGEMSFVGPRPERPVFVEKLNKIIPYYSLRHSVKPGISGWAQICYPYGASEEDALRKLEYDLYYIKNQSIFIDMLVIFRTVKTVLFQKGSR